MADIEQLIKDGLIGATVGAVADTVLHGGIPIETAAAIGAVAADAIDLMKGNESTSRARPSQKQEYKDTTNDTSLKFNARHNQQSNSSAGQAQGGGFNRVHVFHHDAEKDETHAPFSRGDGREDFAFSEPSNYAERLEYEPFATETTTPESCRTESCNTANCAITAKKPKKEVPVEVQQSILKYQGKSPSKPCQKHEVEMPANACYSCGSGGGLCDHLAKYDGTQKSTHCVYPETRLEVASASRRIGKPVKTHRNINRTHLTGIETGHLLALADETSVDDKDSLKQELADHIDTTLSYGENKTALQDYLASVTPLNTDVTEREVRDYEARINTIAPEEVEQANDPFLIESLRERAANGDSSASVQLELMQIKQEGFAQMGITPAPIADVPPIFESAPSPIFESTPPTIFESSPDPAMDWCSSTPETLKFSNNFVPPTEPMIEMESASAPEAMPKSSINQQYIQ